MIEYSRKLIDSPAYWQSGKRYKQNDIVLYEDDGYLGIYKFTASDDLDDSKISLITSPKHNTYFKELTSLTSFNTIYHMNSDEIAIKSKYVKYDTTEYAYGVTDGQSNDINTDNHYGYYFKLDDTTFEATLVYVKTNLTEIVIPEKIYSADHNAWFTVTTIGDDSGVITPMVGIKYDTHDESGEIVYPSIIFPSTLKHIKYYGLNGLYAHELKFPYGLETIAECAIPSILDNKVSIYIPPTVASIGDDIFDGNELYVSNIVYVTKDSDADNYFSDYNCTVVYINDWNCVYNTMHSAEYAYSEVVLNDNYNIDNELYIRSSTKNSNKIFRITIDDDGQLSTSEL